MSNKQNDKYILDEDGLLYNTETESPRLVIPYALTQRVIEQHHESIFSGHQGIKKTIGLLKTRYYWPTLTRDVEEYNELCIL